MANNNFDYNQQNFWNVPPPTSQQYSQNQQPQQQQHYNQQPQDFNFEMPDQFGQEL